MDQADRLRNLLNRNTAAGEAIDKPARVIAITSGKGGVGKSNFTVNLALYLMRKNIRVVILDADFGLANIEILLGVAPRLSMIDVINSNYSIDQVITQTDSGINFISGGSGLSMLANMDNYQLSLITDKLANLDRFADIILIDTGAGISETVMQFVAAAGEAIVVCAPEPTSITDAYSLIKASKERAGEMPRFRIVINRVEDREEGMDIFKNLQRVSGKFLSVNLDYLGAIPYDNNLVKAVKRQVPCMASFPNSAFSAEISNIGAKILDIGKEKSSSGMRGFMRRLANILNR